MGPQLGNFSTPEQSGTRRKWLIAAVTVVTSRLPEFELGFMQGLSNTRLCGANFAEPVSEHQGDP